MPGAVDLYFRVHELTHARAWDELYALLHDDHRQYANGVLIAETREATRAVDELSLGVLAQYERVVHDVFGTDDRAACRSTIVGITHDGRKVEVPLGSIIYVHDGRIAESWMYLDASSVL